MTCANCGKEISSDDRFCSNCGTRVVVQEPIAEESPVQVQAEEQVQESVQAENAIVQQDTEPVQQAVAVAEEIKETLAAPTEKKKGGFFKGLLATLCCVAIFVFMFVGMLVITARSTVKSENVEAVVDDIDTSMMKEVFYTFADDSFSSESTREIIDEIVRKSSIPKAIGEKLGEYGDYVRGGKKPKEITEKDVVKILKQNRNVSELMFDLSIYEYNETERYEKFFEEDVEPELDKIYSDDAFDSAVTIARIALSVWTVIALALLAFVFAFLLFKTRAKKLETLSWAGITCIVMGGLYILGFAAGYIITFTELLDEGINGILSVVLKNITIDAVIIGGVVLVAGILMLVVKKVVRKLKKA